MGFDEAAYRVRVQNLSESTLRAISRELHDSLATLRADAHASSSKSERNRAQEEMGVLRMKKRIIGEFIQGGNSSSTSTRTSYSPRPSHSNNENTVIESSFEESRYQSQISKKTPESLLETLKQLNGEHSRLRADAHASFSSSVRKQKQVELEVVRRKMELVRELIQTLSQTELSTSSQSVETVEAPFNESTYRSHLQNLPPTDLYTLSTQLQEELSKLRTDVLSSFSSAEKQRKEEQMATVRAKRRVVGELLQKYPTWTKPAPAPAPAPIATTSSPRGFYPPITQSITSGSSVQNPVPSIQRQMQPEAPFSESKYLSQVYTKSLESLQVLSKQLQEEITKLRAEAHASLSPTEKQSKEDQMAIVRRKRVIVGDLVQKRSASRKLLSSRPLANSRIEIDSATHRRSDLFGHERQASNSSFIQEGERGKPLPQVPIVGKKQGFLDKLGRPWTKLLSSRRREPSSSANPTREVEKQASPVFYDTFRRADMQKPVPPLPDTSEEVVGHDMGPITRPHNTRPHRTNSTMGGVADLYSTETFDEDFKPTRPIANLDPYYWSSELLD